MFSVFVGEIATIWKCKYYRHASGMRLPFCSILANQKNDNNVILCWHDVMVNYYFSPVKFSYWSKFHVSIITGSGVTTFFVYKGLTRNPNIGNTHVSVLCNIQRYQFFYRYLWWKVTECLKMLGLQLLLFQSY